VHYYLFTSLNRNGEKTISCTADVTYQWKMGRLVLLISQNLHDGKGVLSMSGVLYEKDKGKSYLSKTLSFSYIQNGFFYYLRSELIINSPQMTMSLYDQKEWLPDFFIENNKSLVLKIRPYGKDAWIFYSENTPLFICERSH
jgi:hypothetical protein